MKRALVFTLLCVAVHGCGDPAPEAHTDRDGLKKAARAQIQELRMAAKFFYLDQGRYPASLAELTEPSKVERNGYLDGIPADPWGNEFLLDTTAGLSIRSCGPDGVAGSADDIVDSDE